MDDPVWGRKVPALIILHNIYFLKIIAIDKGCKFQLLRRVHRGPCVVKKEILALLWEVYCTPLCVILTQTHTTCKNPQKTLF